MGQLKLRCCQISSVKQVWDESVLEQETYNEQVGFKGRNGCDNTMYVHDVLFFFVKKSISGRNFKFSKCHAAERQCLWKGGDVTEPLPQTSIQITRLAKIFAFSACAPSVSQKETREEAHQTGRNGWVWSKSCLDNSVHVGFTFETASSPVDLSTRLSAAE